MRVRRFDIQLPTVGPKPTEISMKTEFSAKIFFCQIGGSLGVFDSALKILAGDFYKSQSANMLVQKTCESEVGTSQLALFKVT